MVPMQAPLVDFAKAYVVYRLVYLQKKNIKDVVQAFKGLEAALFELTGTLDAVRITAAVCNRASELMWKQRPRGRSAYISGKALEALIQFMRLKQMLKEDVTWTSLVERKPRDTLKQLKADREKKLPNPGAIEALGEIFNNELTSSLDIVVTSACALLLGAPSRVGELADVEVDCKDFKVDTQGNRRMFLRWYAEKMNQVILKPVVAGMEPAVDRAIASLMPITDEARAYAAWLEDHPDEFPPHAGVPRKGPDEHLTIAEACDALKITYAGNYTPRVGFIKFLKKLEKSKSITPVGRAIATEFLSGWDHNPKRIYIKGKSGPHAHEHHDKFVITLRKLNVLLRDKYLPADFPYTTTYTEGKDRVKYRNALFTVFTGDMARGSSLVPSLGFGVEIAATVQRMNAQLGGHQGTKSIFERWGFPGLKVNTHAFRHELNTRMHQAGLSQLLIDAFSGRTTMGSVYNHETVEERTQRVAAYHPKTKHSTAEQRLEKVKTNQPLSLIDVMELHEGEQDRVIHQTNLGVCIHNFSAEPCPKIGACLDCGRLGCVKGDDVKLGNLKEEYEDLKRRYDKALDAQSRGVFGASESAKKLGEKLFKCEALIQTLENPEIQDGSIVWNADSGWTLTSNAIEMSGLSQGKLIENEAQDLMSLDDVAALLDQVEA